jgi:hypothetical protein
VFARKQRKASVRSSYRFSLEEWLYFQETLESDHLKEARKKELEEQGRKFAKRNILKDYLSTNSEPSVEEIASISVPTIEEVLEERENPKLLNIAEESSTITMNSNLASWTTSTEGTCQRCHESKVNKFCTLVLCAKCCGQDQLFCSLTMHLTKKIKIDPWKKYLEFLDGAMEGNSVLLLRYSGGSTPGEARGIQPKR